MDHKDNPITVQPQRILIVGNAGQLGRELERSFAGLGSIVGVDRDTFDVTDPEAVRELVGRVKPTVILNSSAYTAVDRAESDIAIAYLVNATGTGYLAEQARECNAIFVHYSTDYIFDGSKSGAWTEDDLPNPINAYGASKLAGERAVEALGGKFLIFRTSWVYGHHGNNFLLTMLRLGRERERLSIVDDQIGGPTTSIELADATRKIVEGILACRFGGAEEWAGLYHMTCSGSTSWCGFARAIFQRAASRMGAKAPELTPIPTESYPTPAKRPQNSVLSSAKLASRFGVKLSSWEAALDAVFDQLDSAPRTS
jgi:dTDP-4-dehydrorhamnose reductase